MAELAHGGEWQRGGEEGAVEIRAFAPYFPLRD